MAGRHRALAARRRSTLPGGPLPARPGPTPPTQHPHHEAARPYSEPSPTLPGASKHPHRAWRCPRRTAAARAAGSWRHLRGRRHAAARRRRPGRRQRCPEGLKRPAGAGLAGAHAVTQACHASVPYPLSFFFAALRNTQTLKLGWCAGGGRMGSSTRACACDCLGSPTFPHTPWVCAATHRQAAAAAAWLPGQRPTQPAVPSSAALWRQWPT